MTSTHISLGDDFVDNHDVVDRLSREYGAGEIGLDTCIQSIAQQAGLSESQAADFLGIVNGADRPQPCTDGDSEAEARWFEFLLNALDRVNPQSVTVSGTLFSTEVAAVEMRLLSTETTFSGELFPNGKAISIHEV